jgi:hypothetical protein
MLRLTPAQLGALDDHFLSWLVRPGRRRILRPCRTVGTPRLSIIAPKFVMLDMRVAEASRFIAANCLL